jgi:hypothetical protein
MQFSNALSADSRLRRMGLAANRDQTALVERLRAITAEDDGKNSRKREGLTAMEAYRRKRGEGKPGLAVADHPLWCERVSLQSLYPSPP